MRVSFTSVLAVFLALASPTAARADEINVLRDGPLIGAAFRGGETVYNGGSLGGAWGLEGWLGIKEGGKRALMGRLALTVHPQSPSVVYELGVAGRFWSPSGRTYVEPQLSYVGLEPELDCDGGPCGPSRYSGAAVGLAGGVELHHGRGIGFDLRASATYLAFASHDDGLLLGIAFAITSYH